MVTVKFKFWIKLNIKDLNMFCRINEYPAIDIIIEVWRFGKSRYLTLTSIERQVIVSTLPTEKMYVSLQWISMCHNNVGPWFFFSISIH